eukprot:TRINITY_DN23925_c0_g1_i1.p1 TRINITY_DN23925_c0_g1~~TRINITY_DN23925_c0_g1_i1.p1  ORF type:complete len:173 (+),score=14.60 TRINITY_DN23925_c0_g1_i1:299-817(+)
MSDYASYYLGANGAKPWKTLDDCVRWCQQTSGCRAFDMVLVDSADRTRGKCVMWSVAGATLQKAPQADPRYDTSIYDVSCEECTATLSRPGIVGSQSDNDNYWISQDSSYTLAGCVKYCLKYPCCRSFSLALVTATYGQVSYVLACWRPAASSAGFLTLLLSVCVDVHDLDL